ncbi:hypothetical protein [Paracraurococcus lichenis]|uniref:Uncharacterized protein n=1 Tax=Paracraurococcus lichenis TaxID=3064888 RepID=A0ABT9E6P7_9PROT|nr:hypothetical protein [Paracraurococcus sp. LOR1-02]MDO9711857.1 hypothetical protein [Paracraurococcus sp. LOR1-02]
MKNQHPGQEPAVFAVLAAQTEALRDRIVATTTTQVELLWQAADALTRQAALLTQFADKGAAPQADLAGSCEAATTLGNTLDELAFVQSQRADLLRQMVEGIVTALEHMSATGGALTIEQLAKLYVSQDQLAVHEAIVGSSGKS